MHFEPVKQFWIAPTDKELAAANVRLKAALVSVSVVAVIGWLLFLWRIAQ